MENKEIFGISLSNEVIPSSYKKPFQINYTYGPNTEDREP
jgi:hypothetical protein